MCKVLAESDRCSVGIRIYRGIFLLIDFFEKTVSAISLEKQILGLIVLSDLEICSAAYCEKQCEVFSLH